ncbi:MAG TPA: hypothetical protein VIJ20_14000 [Solirubrobacteraceae bacterium]
MHVHHDAAIKVRLSVCLRRAKLDQEIADGRAFETSAAIALRARQLVDPHTRWQLARSLRGIVDYADRTGPGWVMSAVVIERKAVRAGREAILGLAERLEGGAPVSPRGVARVHTLLTDGLQSPLFNPHTGRTVIQAVWEAADLLGADVHSTGFDAVAL